MTVIKQNPFSDEQLADLAANDEYAGLPAGTSANQIWQESRNNGGAVSPKGAIGFAQVMPSTLKSLNAQLGRTLDPTNWQDSMIIQRTLMKQNMVHVGNAADALAAYNSGWDRSKWGNPETQAYVAALAGGASVSAPSAGIPRDGGDPNADDPDNPLVPHFRAPASSASMTPIDREAALRAGAAGTIVAGAAQANATESARPDLDTSLYDTIGKETAAQVASETQHAGGGETFVQSFMWNTITGRMLDHMTQESADPQFKWDEKKLGALQQSQPELYNNDDMREYVTGAGSELQAQQRIAEAVSHLDWERRYSNTKGLAGAGDFLMTELGAMADPVVLAATMGLGAGVNAVRGAAEATMMARMAGSAVEGALVNEALGKGIAEMDNHEFGWKDVVNQGVAGAALGAVMGLIPHKSKLEAMDPGVKADGLDSLHENATKTANDVLNDITEREIVDTKGLDKDGGILDPHNTDHDKVVTTDDTKRPTEVQDAIDRVKQDELRETEADDFKEVEDNKPAIEVDDGGNARVEDHDLTENPVENDIKPNVEEKVKQEELLTQRFKGGKDEFDVGRWLSPSQKQMLREGKVEKSTARAELERILRDGDDHEKALAGRLLESIEGAGATIYKHDEPGRSFHTSADNSVHMFSSYHGGATGDRITLHEIAHAVSSIKLHYGETHPLTVHGKLYRQFNALRVQALREFNKKIREREGSTMSREEMETKYYLDDTKEYLAGLFSKHPDFLDHLRSIKAKKGLGDVLSKTVNVLRTILGLKPNETNYLTQSMGLADQIIDSRNIRTHVTFDTGHEVVYTAAPEGMQRADVPLGPLAQTIEKQLQALASAGDPKELAAVRARGTRWYESWRGKTGIGRALGVLDSVGLKLGTSDNEMVRAVASMLCEDATGLNRRGGTSAAIDKAMLAANWRTPMVNMWNELAPNLMTARERAEVMAGGGNETLKRIGKQVQEERLRHRAARGAGEEYVSQAPQEIRRLAAAMDGMFKDMTAKGVTADEATLKRVAKSGWQGYMPYRFDDSALRKLFRDAGEDPAKAADWNSLKSNFQTQYVDRLTEPMRKKMSNAGPVEERELLRRVTEMAENRTNDYFTQIMRQQGDRVLGADDHFANVAASMLDDVRALNGRKATRLTKELIKNFRRDLADVISDKSRTEFDLLREVNGVRMLDYMDTDFGRMVEQNTSHYAGAIALAKRGIKDDAHWTAVKDVLAKHGAKDEDLSNLEFVRTSLVDGHTIQDNPAAAALQSATALALMGKVGLNGLGDAGALVGAVGVGGFLKAFGRSFKKDTALMAQLKTSATSALGLDHRLKFHDTSAGVQAHAGSMLTHPMYRNVVHGLGTALSWMSLSRPVAIAAHRAAVPAITEELVKAVRGAKFGDDGRIVATGSGTLTPARLVDTGLTSERVKVIQELLETHDAGRKEGDLINWSKWDQERPGFAEDFIGSIHRVTSQVLQRAYIGEQPRWQVETQMGRFITQFRQQGLLGAEKQFARNMSHADRVTMQQFAFNTAWAAGLYWAKTEASTVGMDSATADEYRQKRYSGVSLAAGVTAMTNISGIASDALYAANVVFGGQSNGTSPFAAMGYLKNVSTAVNRVGKQATGDESADIHKTVGSVFKTLPLSNTFIGTALVNGISQ